MGDKRRWGLPYIWATWIAGLLSGDKHCAWAAWYKAHFRYLKREDPDANRLTVWKADHAAMVRARVSELQSEGWHVTVEEQNKFTVEGQVATVGGVADIVAYRDFPPAEELVARGIALHGVPAAEDLGGPVVRIEDAKTGKRRDSDFWQVATYMYLMPKVTPAMRDRAIHGLILYRDGEQRRLESGTGQQLGPTIAQFIREIAGDLEPERTPSASECRYCDIAVCPDRVEQDLTSAPATYDTEDF